MRSPLVRGADPDARSRREAALLVEAPLLACPACGATEADDSRPASGFEFLAGGRAFRHPPYSVRQCTTCGLYFKSARISDWDLGDYYAHLEHESFAPAAAAGGVLVLPRAGALADGEPFPPLVACRPSEFPTRRASRPLPLRAALVR